MMGDAIAAILLFLLMFIVVSSAVRTGREREDDRIRQECADFGSFVIDGAKYECLLVGRSGQEAQK